MKLLVLTCATIVAAAAGPSLAADMSAKPAPQCFTSRDIGNHTSDGDRTLYLNVRQHDTWRVTMSNNCLGAGLRTDPLVMRNFTGSDTICRPLDLDVGVHTNGFTSHCIVSGMAKMTPAEVAALPPKLRP